jgi:hypothetical protein
MTGAAVQYVADKGQRGGEVGQHNHALIRQWFIDHPCATNREAASALGLSEMAIGRHVRKIRAEWGAA